MNIASHASQLPPLDASCEPIGRVAADDLQATASTIIQRLREPVVCFAETFPLLIDKALAILSLVTSQRRSILVASHWRGILVLCRIGHFAFWIYELVFFNDNVLEDEVSKCEYGMVYKVTRG